MNNLSLGFIVDTTMSNPETTIMVGLAILGLIVMALVVLWLGPIERIKPTKPVPPQPGINEGKLAQWYWFTEYASPEKLKEWEDVNLPGDIRGKKAK